MDREVWNSLSSKHQIGWDKISEKGKMAIMLAFEPSDASLKNKALTQDESQ